MSERPRGGPPKKDRRLKRDEPQYPLRREILGVSARVAGVAAGEVVLSSFGAGFVWFHYLKDNLQIARILAEYERMEGNLEGLVTSFEEGFGNFATTAKAKIEASNLSRDEKNILLIPFQIEEINRGNSDRNIYTLKKKDLKTKRSLAKQDIATQNANYYYYDFLTGEGAAAYYPPARSILLSKTYDGKNILDNLVAYHELVHAGQDNQDREELPRQVYDTFFADAERRKVYTAIGIYEASAFSNEIHLLNLMTDGQFKTDVLAGRVDVVKFRNLLNARPEQDGLINLLVDMARQLYSVPTPVTDVHARFLGYINQVHRNKGMEVYERIPTGFRRIL